MQHFQQLLEENILPFWINQMQDHEHGGFYGRIDGNNQLHAQANKGSVLNARILWTFSAAYRLLKNPVYLAVAQRAFDYITAHFIDETYGGIYWELDYQGRPVNTKKQTYAQGFALYGFSEFYRATGNEQALELAKQFFFLLEKCHDDALGGYLEAYTRDWQAIEDVRLSDKDANEKKTMNTHLHVLEPYTNLLRIWKDERLIQAQRRLIGLFTDHIVNSQTHHLDLFFDEEWNLKSSAVSYGHDIEASWLLFEAAETLDDPQLLEKIKSLSLQIADAADEGLQTDGSMIYEKDGDHADRDRHWWVQAESVVGNLYAYRNSGNLKYKENAEQALQYIENQLLDKENGEWHWSRKADGSLNRIDDKAGFWKCPYHNGRMCMEIIEHFKS
ncbi:MAG: AGE family epimerase/isomerase [Dysgonamonadaceae bacterium]|jgi:mannobiose 2-epimerase|nr:AGE family epimerase/isomerase [Dysgonamonadaceae bacterium]